MSKTDTSAEAVADFTRRAGYALHDMQGRVEAGKLKMFARCICMLEAVAAERDRQYDENAHRVAKQAEAESRAEAAEAEVARLRDINARLCDWIEHEAGCDLPFDARAALQEPRP